MAKAKKKESAAEVEVVKPRLLDVFRQEAAPKVMKEYELGSIMQVPRLQKIVINMGTGEALTDRKALDNAVGDLTMITGQQPVRIKARVSISSFKLREGNLVGTKVTLRGLRMWHFFERLVSVALPRVRDFRGVSTRSFDGRGNYNLGLTEQIIFPEIKYDKVDAIRGMDVAFVFSGERDDLTRAVLTELGMPFRKN